MDRSYSKPQAAREIEARARARQLRVRVVVVAEGESYTTASRSRPGLRYTMQRTPSGWVCSCDGYFHTGACKHLGQVERRSEREGWDFGTVAPLHRAAKYLPLALPARKTRKRVSPADTPIPFRPAAVEPHNDDRRAA